jgi:hypothetical protein
LDLLEDPPSDLAHCAAIMLMQDLTRYLDYEQYLLPLFKHVLNGINGPNGLARIACIQRSEDLVYTILNAVADNNLQVDLHDTFLKIFDAAETCVRSLVNNDDIKTNIEFCYYFSDIKSFRWETTDLVLSNVKWLPLTSVMFLACVFEEEDKSIVERVEYRVLQFVRSCWDMFINQYMPKHGLTITQFGELYFVNVLVNIATSLIFITDKYLQEFNFLDEFCFTMVEHFLNSIPNQNEIVAKKCYVLDYFNYFNIALQMTDHDEFIFNDKQRAVRFCDVVRNCIHPSQVRLPARDFGTTVIRELALQRSLYKLFDPSVKSDDALSSVLIRDAIICLRDTISLSSQGNIADEELLFNSTLLNALHTLAIVLKNHIGQNLEIYVWFGQRFGTAIHKLIRESADDHIVRATKNYASMLLMWSRLFHYYGNSTIFESQVFQHILGVFALPMPTLDDDEKNEIISAACDYMEYIYTHKGEFMGREVHIPLVIEVGARVPVWLEYKVRRALLMHKILIAA